MENDQRRRGSAVEDDDVGNEWVGADDIVLEEDDKVWGSSAENLEGVTACIPRKMRQQFSVFVPARGSRDRTNARK